MFELIRTYFSELYILSSEMAPYLLLGFLFAGILHVYIRRERIARFLGADSLKSVVYASLLGVPLPLCSCGVIPTGIAFRREGASTPATLSFLISTPQTGVDSILVTWSLLGWPFALIRPIVAFLTGIAGGALSVWTGRSNAARVPAEEPSVPTGPQPRGIVAMLRYAFIDFMEDIAKWLVVGLGLAALMAVLIPDGFFTQYINNPLLSMGIVLLASVPLYVCATGSVPIAAVLMMKGLSPGAALVFLMAGPATNIATITVIGKTLGKKALAVYLTSIIGGALFFGFLTDLLFSSGTLFSVTEHLHHSEHHLIPAWINITSLAILSFFTLLALARRAGLFRKSNQKKTMEEFQHHFKVTGMTCQHCKSNVEKAILGMEGVESVDTDLATGKVAVKAERFDLQLLQQRLESLGYGLRQDESDGSGKKL